MTDPADTVPGREPASTMYRRIVVGVNGSSHSLGALRHAAELGVLLGVDVVAVRAWGPRAKYTGLSSGSPDLREQALSGVEEAITRAFANQPPECVTGVVREGDPADVLISESGRHDLLVVGSRGHGSVVGLALGSVSARCAERARCPVLVYHAASAATAG